MCAAVVSSDSGNISDDDSDSCEGGSGRVQAAGARRKDKRAKIEAARCVCCRMQVHVCVHIITESVIAAC